MDRKLIFAFCLILVLGFAFGSFAKEVSLDEDVVSKADVCDKYIGLKSKLNLTDEQAQKIKNIKTNFGEKNASLIKERNRISKELREILKAEEPDFGAVEAKVKELQNVRTEIMLNKLRSAKEAQKVLTAEQKEKLKEIAKPRIKKMIKKRTR